MVLRVVALNVWGGRLYKPLMKLLPTLNADVYCFQEVFDHPARKTHLEMHDSRTKAINPDDRGRASLFELLQDVLPGHRGVFCPASLRTIKISGSEGELQVYFGIATFVRKTIPVIASHSSFVHKRYEDVERLPPLPRVAHAIRIKTEDIERPVVVAHMHGLWTPSGKDDSPERAEQAKLFGKIIRAVMEAGDRRFVICGDFNVLPTSFTFDVLEMAVGAPLYEQVRHNGYDSTRTSFYTDNPDKKDASLFADYMLVSEVLKVLNFEVVRDPEVADHCPLVVDVVEAS